MNSSHTRRTGLEVAVRFSPLVQSLAEPMETLLPNQLPVYNFLSPVSRMQSTKSLADVTALVFPIGFHSEGASYAKVRFRAMVLKRW